MYTMIDGSTKKLMMLILLIISIFTFEINAQGIVLGPQSTKTQKTQSQQTQKKSDSRKSISLSEPDGYINGHGYVDLGLPSGVKWATVNIGGILPSDYGDYYAWGETITKSDYSVKNYSLYLKWADELKSEGIINSLGNLTAKYDAATANWGSTWRMPTKAELEELKHKCKWKYIEINGKKGYKIVGPNKKSIFIPGAGGWCYDHFEADGGGFYWSSTIFTNCSAYNLVFFGSGWNVYENSTGPGYPVRPVSL